MLVRFILQKVIYGQVSGPSMNSFERSTISKKSQSSWSQKNDLNNDKIACIYDAVVN